MNKKGLSEVITTVLIILLVLGAIVLIWTVIRPMIQNSSEQINADALTSSLSIVPNSAIITFDGNITLKVKRNAEAGDITAVNVILETASGQRKTFKVTGEIKELESKTIIIPASQHGITETITNVLVSAVVTNTAGKEITSSIISSSSKVTPPAPAVCGDGNIQYGEPCDKTNLNGQTCQTLGYLAGTLNCTSSCAYDASQCFDLNNGLVSYYKFDESSYSGTAGEVKDQKGRNNGTTNGGMSTLSGKVGNSARFDGSNDYISVPSLDGLSFNFSKNFSISTWVKPISSSNMIFVGLTHPNSWEGGDNILFMSDRALEVQIWGAGLFNTSTNSIPINTWTYASWTYSESDRKGILYLNGAKGSDLTFNRFSQSPSTAFRIGRYASGTLNMNGTMDEFMLFNRTLSDKDINLLYNSYS